VIKSLVDTRTIKEVNNTINLYSYERILIQPNTKKIITLPYKRDNLDKYLNFELDRFLILNGLQVLWTNINEESSKGCFEFILYNNNLDKESLNYFRDSPLAQIVGSKDKIDILSNTLLGKIYIN
jgi:hypothetical protein